MKTAIICLSLFAIAIKLITYKPVKLDGYDEIYYGRYIKILAEDGIDGYRNMIRKVKDSRLVLTVPPPFRIFFIYAGLMACKLSGSFRLENIAVISHVCWFFTLIISFILLHDWFDLKTAFLSLLVITVSPLGIALSQRALQDTFFSMLMILSVYCFHRCWTNNKGKDSFLLFIVLTIGVLTKESMFFMYPCFFIISLYYRIHFKEASMLKVFIPILSAPICYVIIVSWIAGDFNTFWELYVRYLDVLHKNRYVIKYQGGPWFRYIVDFVLISPVIPFLAAIGVLRCLDGKHSNSSRGATLLLLFSALSIIFFGSMPIFNLRYVLFFDIFLRTLAILGLFQLLDTSILKRYSKICIAPIILFLLCIDIYQFNKIYNQKGVYDPITKNLIYANGFINE